MSTKQQSSVNPSAGGRARAAKLTKQERSEIARKAAEARWGVGRTPKAIYGSPDSPLRIADIEIPCYVLDDGRRVLSQVGMQTGVGFSRSGGKSGSRRLAGFVTTLERKGLDTKGLAARIAEPISFVPPHGGIRVVGYEATILAELCDAILAARKETILLKQQEHIADQAEVLVRGFARVGIIALVDEATGYQDARARDALAKILEEFIAKELRKWISTFPAEFYKQLFRLRRWAYDPQNVKRPQLVGKLTNQIVYERLAPGILEELRQRNPVDEKGRRKHKHFQYLTEDTGNPKLREHLASVVSLMKISETWEEFRRHLDKAHPPTLSKLPLFEKLEGS